MNTNSMVTTSIDVNEIFDALETFIKQKPGVDPNNYFSPWGAPKHREAGIRSYRSELRDIAKDKKRALKALDEARGLTPPLPDALRDAFRAFSGRLSWIPRPHDGRPCAQHEATGFLFTCYECGHSTGKLEYVTGQYFPTEYRKAAASVLESYIAAWRQHYAAQHPRTFTYQTLADVKAANRSIGHHWFDASTLHYFNTKFESGLIAGKRFITSERMDDEHAKRYTIREAQADGTIDTVGEFQEYGTLEEARAAVMREWPEASPVQPERAK